MQLPPDSKTPNYNKLPGSHVIDTEKLAGLSADIRKWSEELGFQQTSVAGIDLPIAEQHLAEWLDKGYQGEMAYMSDHGVRRSRPAELIPGTLRVISTRMNYLPDAESSPAQVLESPTRGYIARYALGRDYHKLIRKRLQRLIHKIQAQVDHQYAFRAFTDSAPVMEKAIAETAGLGWIGKNTLLLTRATGSWFFIGEIYTDLPLPLNDVASGNYCGTCQACLDICPTQAFTGPYQLDARRCISYLTIEHKGSIPVNLRTMIGNRIFGCDDCQLVCPWNRFARYTLESDFQPRHGLDSPDLIDLFDWSEEQYLTNTEGSALRRTGYVCWQRNLAVALGNAPRDARIVKVLSRQLSRCSELVAEHVRWALDRHSPTVTQA